jgi:hypothetical protein
MGSKPIFPDMFRKSALMFNIFCTKKVRLSQKASAITRAQQMAVPSQLLVI